MTANSSIGLRRALTLLLATGLLAGASGCAGTFPNPFAGKSGSNTLSIYVDNQNFNDVRVYALTTRGPQVLGQVGGRSNRNFRMEWKQLDEIRFRLEFLAGRSYETNRVNAAPGDRLDIYIGDNPNNALVRRR
ncbi:MAG: hypothetical protein ACE5GJ_04595 [Gemmatimonadota bacterium]